MFRPKIAGRLGIGFGIGIIFTLLVGLVSLDRIDRLSKVTELIYAHPFAVTNALREAKAILHDLRGAMDDLTAAPIQSDVEARAERIHGLKGDIAGHFAVIRTQYLGPRRDTERMQADYEALLAYCETVIAQTRNGAGSQARELWVSEAPAAFTAVRTDMDVAMAFAERRARNFIEEARNTRDAGQPVMLFIIIAGLGLGIIGAWLVARSITRPLEALRASMEELSMGNLDAIVTDVDRHDEIGEMARALQVFKDSLIRNDMLERTLRQAHKMEAIGQMTGGVAHDFNNLLQVIIANLDLGLQSLGTGTAAARYLQNAMAGAEQGGKLTSQLLAFARRQPLNPASLRLDRLVGDMASLLRRTIGERIGIEMVNSGGLWTALVDENQLQNAILNLAINARDAMPDGGKLTIELANTTLDEAYAANHSEVKAGQYVMLAVTDTGVGMSPEIAARAFEPFFTTKPEGVGTGLGLSMVFGFVKQSGGHIKIYSEVDLGTTIKLYFPRTQQSEVMQAAEMGKAVRGNGETILVAEDDDGVRASVVTELAELGYRVLAAANGEAALDILTRGEQVDLLFTDVVMPGNLNGRGLADRARKHNPELRVVFTSGYTENAIIHNGRLDEGVTLLSKPYRLSQLAETIRGALGRSAVPMSAPPPVAPPAPKNEPTQPQDGDPSILIVEDNDIVRVATIDMLEALGHRVQAVDQPIKALQQLAATPSFKVLITDLNLPGMDGLTLARQARASRPGLSVVIASGSDIDQSELADLSASLLPKPYSLKQLKDALTMLTG